MGVLAKDQEFIARCSADSAVREAVAGAISLGLKQVLSDAGVPLHVVAARAKTIDSIRAKLLSKEYSNPLREMTDQIGARVIVYRSAEVNVAAEIIKRNVRVVGKYSVDKREALGLREFGYRSYHLVCKIPTSLGSVRIPRMERGPGMFEVQVRSILEHSWAEIEHGVAYKSGADLSNEIKRRFASVAGVLELLEFEFQRLAGDTSGLVDAAKAEIQAGRAMGKPLDVPHLVAILEIERADGLGFREAGASFPFGIERRLVLAMKKCSLGAVSKVSTALQTPRLKSAVKKYARSQSISASECSHLAVAMLLIGLSKPEMIQTYFPEFWADLSLRRALS